MKNRKLDLGKTIPYVVWLLVFFGLGFYETIFWGGDLVRGLSGIILIFMGFATWWVLFKDMEKENLRKEKWGERTNENPNRTPR